MSQLPAGAVPLANSERLDALTHLSDSTRALYLSEDQLVWKKVQTVLIVTGALGATAGVGIDKGPPTLLVIAIIAGIASSLLFSQTVRSSRVHIKQRKANFNIVTRELEAMAGIVFEKDPSVAIRTSVVLEILTWTVGVAWIGFALTQFSTVAAEFGWAPVPATPIQGE